jgi:hypothetical protein
MMTFSSGRAPPGNSSPYTAKPANTSSATPTLASRVTVNRRIGTSVPSGSPASIVDTMRRLRNR